MKSRVKSGLTGPGATVEPVAMGFPKAAGLASGQFSWAPVAGTRDRIWKWRREIPSRPADT